MAGNVRLCRVAAFPCTRFNFFLTSLTCASGSRDPVNANPESRDGKTGPGLQSLLGTVHRCIVN